MKKRSVNVGLACVAAVCIGICGGSSGEDPSASDQGREQSRIEGALKRVGKDISKQNEERKLLYTVLLLQASQPDKAIRFYDANFTEKDRGGILVRMALVQALQEKEEISRATGVLVGLAKSVEASSIRARANYMGGLSFLQAGERDIALGPFTRATREDPTFAPAYYEIAELAQTKEEIIRNCAATLALVPPDSRLAKKARALLLQQLEKEK